jgi:putative RecB family exonuclease
VPVYSHSRLSTYEKCPLQYRFRYLDKIKRDTQGIEAFMGKRVHEVLEKLYRDLMMSKRPSLDELVATYHRRWNETFNHNVKIVRTEYTADHYRRVGERGLAGYYRRYEPFDQATTLGLEDPISLTLDEPGRYKVQGYIDRLARAEEGVYEIHDYKTASYLPSDQGLRKDRQLALYQMAVEKRFRDVREVRLIWHYLVFDQELTSRRTPEEIERHRRLTIGLIDRIEETRTFPPRESALCRWCEYRDICPVQKHLVHVEVLVPAEPPDYDGVRLVDRRVEQAILPFADRERAMALRGTAHTARLKGDRRRVRKVTLSRIAPEQINLFG